MFKLNKLSYSHLLMFIVAFTICFWLVGGVVRVVYAVHVMWSDEDDDNVDRFGEEAEAQVRWSEDEVKKHPLSPDAHLKLAQAYDNVGNYEDEKMERQKAADLQSHRRSR